MTDLPPNTGPEYGPESGRPSDYQYAPGTTGAEYEQNARRGLNELARILYLYVPLFAAAALILWLARALGAVLFIVVLALVVWAVVRIILFKGSFRALLGKLFAGWAKDWPHFVQFVRLALQRKDDRTTLALAHRQQFLAGRMLSPVRIGIGTLVTVIAVSGGAVLWFWRDAEHSARLRDASCSARELSGHTTRQACVELISMRQQRDAYSQAHARVLDAVHDRDAIINHERETCDATVTQATQRARQEIEARAVLRRRRIDHDAASTGGGVRRDPYERLRELAAESALGTGGDLGAAPAASPADPIGVPAPTASAPDLPAPR